MADEVEIFQTGLHTDKNGVRRYWSEADLRTIEQTYNSQSAHEAPITLGHPADNAPAYGWIEKLRVDAGKLYATLKQVAPEFIEWVRAGRYKKRSPAFYPDLLLRHVAWLGASPPAVKGMADFAFQDIAENTSRLELLFEEQDGSISPIQQFQEGNAMNPDEVKQVLDGLAAINTALGQINGKLDKVISADAAASGGQKNAGGNPPPAGHTGNPPAQAFSEEAQQRITALEAENKTLAEKQQESEFSEFLSSPDMHGRVSPKMRPRVLATMKLMAAQKGEYEFAEGQPKQTALENYKLQLKEMPVIVEFAELATRELAEKNGSVNTENDKYEQAGASVAEAWKKRQAALNG